jgi:heat shock protein HtpX
MKNASCPKNIRIRMVEVEGEEAFACYAGTIAVSAELLKKLTDEELKGVLAHELGHLVSRDTTLAWAFVTAGQLPAMVRWVFFVTQATLWRVAGLALPVLILLFLFKPLFLMPIIAVLLFLMSFWLLDRVFRWLRLFLSRRGEYRQDAFAHRLGYGRGLRDALIKLAHYGREPVNAYFMLMNGTHPIIYDRIRRLERLMSQ